MVRHSFIPAGFWAIGALLLPAAVAAAPLSFQADSAGNPATLSCQIKVEKIGSLQLTNGQAIIHGNTVEIVEATDQQTPPKTILKGLLLRVESDTDAMPAQVSGLAYFQEGPSLSEIDDAKAGDLIFKRDGAVSGRIIGLSGYNLEIVKSGAVKTTLDVSTVKFVRSPRAFLFRLSIDSIAAIPNAVAFRANASSLSFKSTARERTLPLSSILPERSSQPSDNKLSKFGEGAGETDPTYEEDDEGIVPTFKWGMPGIPFKPEFPGGKGGF